MSLFKSDHQIGLNYSEYGILLILSRCKQLMETEDISNTAGTSGKNRAGFKLSAVLDKTSQACTFRFFYECQVKDAIITLMFLEICLHYSYNSEIWSSPSKWLRK